MAERKREVGRISRVEIKFKNTGRTISGEGAFPSFSDAEVRRHGEQTGFDTLVVRAVNDAF
jgi:hypothetical protein